MQIEPNFSISCMGLAKRGSMARASCLKGVSGMRDEIRGLNERIDKFIVGVFNCDP